MSIITRTLAAVTAAAVLAGCGGGLEPVAELEAPDTAPATAAASEVEEQPAGTDAAPTTAAPTVVPTTAAPTTSPPEPEPDEGSYGNPADWQGPLGTDELTLQVVSLGWQADVSAYDFFDDELCAEPESSFDCEVLEGKGVLVLRYDVARTAGEPGMFLFFHKLAMDNGRLVDGSGLHCAGDEMIELAPGGDPQTHETCFVVDTAEIGDQALIGLSAGMFTDHYWVQVPITG